MPILQADAVKEKRREYYLRRREYYLEQNRIWREANREHKNNLGKLLYRKTKDTHPELYMWKQAKERAKTSGLEFTIQVEDIKMTDVCPYMGTPFVMGDKQLAASLDRIDSSKGYTKENIRVISYMANKMKNNATEAQLIAFAKGVLVVHPGQV